jgi:hypothetical protein
MRLKAEDLFRNYSLELLLTKIAEEKDRETQRYFSNLAGNAIAMQHNNAPDENGAMGG